MPKIKLTLNEIIAKADNIGEIVGKVKNLVQEARKADDADSPGGEEVTVEEIEAIKAAAQEIVDAAQELADEVVEDLFD